MPEVMHKAWQGPAFLDITGVDASQVRDQDTLYGFWQEQINSYSPESTWWLHLELADAGFVCGRYAPDSGLKLAASSDATTDGTVSLLDGNIDVLEARLFTPGTEIMLHGNTMDGFTAQSRRLTQKPVGAPTTEDGQLDRVFAQALAPDYEQHLVRGSTDQQLTRADVADTGRRWVPSIAAVEQGFTVLLRPGGNQVIVPEPEVSTTHRLWVRRHYACDPGTGQVRVTATCLDHYGKK